MRNASETANFFLSKESMSNKKLQKLTYYAYAWTLALLNENAEKMQYHLFNEPIEAWVHGPVIPDLYQKYKEYGWMDIPKDNLSFNFSPDELDILNQVWDAYGSFSANELENISHQEAPWKKARLGLAPYSASSKRISDKDMFEYYNEQASQ